MLHPFPAPSTTLKYTVSGPILSPGPEVRPVRARSGAISPARSAA